MQKEIIKFHIKRFFCSIPNIIFIIFFIFIPIFCLKIGERINIPNIGFIDNLKEDYYNDDNFTKSIKQRGYIEYNNIDLMKNDIDNGKIDAGFVIPNDLYEKIEKNEVDGIIDFLYCDSSLYVDLRKAQIFSDFMKFYTPYIINNILKNLNDKRIEDISINDVKNEYNSLFFNEKNFDVNIIKVDGKKVIEENRGKIYFILSLVYLSFIYLIFGVVLTSLRLTNCIEGRIEKKVLFNKVFLSSITYRLFMLILMIVVVLIIKTIVI